MGIKIQNAHSLDSEQETVIYLFSSNATQRYLIDTLQSLAFPSGYVQHYRYQLKYVEPALRSQIPLKSESLELPKLNSEIVVCYLYQQLDAKDGRWKMKAVYPARRGLLLHCHRTGDQDTDIAHFYFQLSERFDYRANYTRENLEGALKTALGNEYLAKPFYVRSGRRVESPISDLSTEESATHSFGFLVKSSHWASPDGKTQYFPSILYVHGLVRTQHQRKLLRKKNLRTALELSLDESTLKSFYKLQEAIRYVFEISYYFDQTPGYDSQMKMNLIQEHFISPSENVIHVSSRYDEESLLVLPRSLTEKETLSTIELTTEINAPSAFEGEASNFGLSFPVLITRRMFWRRVFALADLLSDGSLALATYSATLFTVKQESYLLLPAGIGLAVWALLKVPVRLWKGE